MHTAVRPVTSALALSLTVVLAGQAQAARPAPTPPPGVGYFAEAPTGEHREQYDDFGSEVTVIDGRWLLLHTFGYTPEGEDTLLALWFGTRAGSRFYLTGCDDANNRTGPERVSRKQFLARVASTPEREIHFTYDAERDRGVFVVTTGWFVDGEGLYPCPGLPAQ